jgi:glycosyltransferase involved in cell wall biosynthesis
MKAEIVHVSGFDSYDTHDSGNYIVFNFLRSTNFNSKMALTINKTKNDEDTYFIKKDQFINSFEEIKILILHDETFDFNEIEKIYNKFKCQIIFYTQTHCVNRTKFCKGEISYPELNDEETRKHNESHLINKKNVFKNLPITVVCASSYTFNHVKESIIYENKDIFLFPLPGDVPYCKSPKQKVRKHLGLQNNRKYILWGTTNPKSFRKGKHLFDESLDYLWNTLSDEQREEIVIINVGPFAGKFGTISNFNTIFCGYQATRREMSVHYRACDISVCTTIADGGPMMISESMCNETPVIAFDRSISCDLCVDGETGYLIKNLNTESMANAIKQCLFADDLPAMSTASRKKYLEFHDKDKILEKWNTLFASLL